MQQPGAPWWSLSARIWPGFSGHAGRNVASSASDRNFAATDSAAAVRPVDVEAVDPIVDAPIAGPTEIDVFVAAYRDTLPAVFAYLMRATGGDRPLSEDLCGEAYLDALAAWRDGRAPELSAAWFTGIARHKMIDAFRRAEREQRKLTLIAAGESDEAPDDFAVVDRAELLSCARRLPPLQRAVLALRYGDDLPVAEIGRRLDKDTAAIDSLLRPARAGLRRMLAGDDEGDD